MSVSVSCLHESKIDQRQDKQKQFKICRDCDFNIIVSLTNHRMKPFLLSVSFVSISAVRKLHNSLFIQNIFDNFGQRGVCAPAEKT